MLSPQTATRMVSAPMVASKPVADWVTWTAAGPGNCWPGICAKVLADAAQARATRRVRVESMYFSMLVGSEMRGRNSRADNGMPPLRENSFPVIRRCPIHRRFQNTRSTDLPDLSRESHQLLVSDLALRQLRCSIVRPDVPLQQEQDIGLCSPSCIAHGQDRK